MTSGATPSRSANEAVPRALASAEPVRAEPDRAEIVCTLPTYNEAGNVVALAREILALDPRYHVLVIDDASPDGTAELVEREARTQRRLHLLLRTRDRGRGRSGRDGFVQALAMGARIVVEMDADFSHQPRYIPGLIAALEGDPRRPGLVLGSRAVSGGSDADRGLFRRFLTKAANLYIRVLLGVPVRDCNSGFRCWARATLERIDVARTFSPGPAIVQELLFKTARARIGIVELPIEFANRLHGESTLTFRSLLQGYTTVLKLRWMSLTGRL